MGFTDMQMQEFKRQEIKSGGVELIAIPNIFNYAQIRRTVPAGLTVAEMVTLASPNRELIAHAHVMIGMDEIPDSMWHCIRLREGSVISVRFIPAGGGGGGKNPLTTILSIALLVVAPEIGGALAAMTGGWVGNLFIGQAIMGAIFTAGIGIIGSMAIRALAPPPKQSFSNASASGAGGAAGAVAAEKSTLFIQGSQNSAALWGTVPRVFGKMRMVPPLGAQTYTEIVGNDQYLRMLFVWGYGPLTITDLKIGETPLSDFVGVETQTLQGYPGDAPLTLYSDEVIQTDLQIAATNVAGYSIRTTDPNADEISVDIVFPNGLGQLSPAGAKINRTVSISVGYSIKGANSWSDTTYTYSAQQTAAIRENVRFVVSKNQYDVRVSRLTADSTDASIFDTAIWSALRTIRYTAPVTMKGLAMTAVRIKASDQLNGVINQFNGVVQSILPDWNGAIWAMAATSNPAAIYRAILQGSANARPIADSRINLTALQIWRNDCAAASREYNAILAATISVQDALGNVASIGRAAPALIDGKWTVVEDKAKTTPIQHFTPRNSWGFTGQKAYPDQPHALRVQFINRDNGWNADERIVYDDGYDVANATKFETLNMDGVTSSDQAWRDGRYHIASARLRPEIYSFSVDIEHLVCTRGDLIKFTHDAALFGIQSGRITALTTSGSNITTITLDAAVTMAVGKNYGGRFRKSDGTTLRLVIVNSFSTGTTVTLETPYASATGPAVGDLFMFGERNSETVDLIVKSIVPAQDLTALITCVDAAPLILAAETGLIPAFNSQITTPPEFFRPPAPVVSTTQSGDSVLIINADGSFKPSIVITLKPSGYGAPTSLRVKIQASGETTMHPAVYTVSGNQITITGVQSGGIYTILLGYNNLLIASMGSADTTLAGVLVTGGTSVPEDITGFNANIFSNVAHLSWNALALKDALYFTVKFNTLTTGATWANSFPMVDQVAPTATAIAVPSMVGTYLIKAVNNNGESVNAVDIVSTVASLVGLNLILAVTESPTFSGTQFHTTTDGTTLRLAGLDTVDSWPDVDLVANFDVGPDGIAPSGTYTFATTPDLGAVYTSTIYPAITVIGADITTIVDNWPDFDNVADIDGAAVPSNWSISLEIRTTSDDPAGSPTWSAWQVFVIGEYTARAFQFRINLFSEDINVTPEITALTVTIDMPDRQQSQRNLTSASTDTPTVVTFPNTFKATPTIVITAQSMATGDYFTITNPTSSNFEVIFQNAAAARITRTFDYTAQGYGKGA